MPRCQSVLISVEKREFPVAKSFFALLLGIIGVILAFFRKTSALLHLTPSKRTFLPQISAILHLRLRMREIVRAAIARSARDRVPPHRDCSATLNGVAHSETTSSLGTCGLRCIGRAL
jgi:hypothetical protein